MRPRHFLLLVLAAGGAAAENRLILEAGPGDWRPGSYRDVTVLAATEARPLGAARFDILVSNTQALRHVAVFGDQIMARGGLVPLSDATPGSAPSLTSVAAFNAVRPDAPLGTNRVATLRFQVTGEPGANCTIILTNAELWSTAALPTNETAAIAPCRPLDLASNAMEYSLTISGAEGHALNVAGFPSEWQKGKLYPIRLTGDAAGEFLSGFDATLSYPTGALEVLDVSTLDRQRPVTWSAVGGQTRLLGVQGSTLREGSGAQDLATVWLAVRDTPPAAGEEVTLSAGRLLTAPALDSHILPVSNVTVSVTRVAPSQRAILTLPPSTNIHLNSEFETPVAVEVESWPPWLVGGWLTFDPAKVIVVDIQPTGLLTEAAFTTDTNTFTSGLVPFVWSDFSRADLETNGVLELMNIRWRVTGGTLESGTVLSELCLADGIWNGWDTAALMTNLPFLIRFSPTDMDGDGIPDWWAIQYYGGETNVAADGDTDFDGMTAWEEYVARTDPTNRLSLLEMLSIARAGPDVSVTWASVTGVIYRLRRSTNLWEAFDAVVADGIEASASTHAFTDTNAPPGPALFYRVTVPVPAP